VREPLKVEHCLDGNRLRILEPAIFFEEIGKVGRDEEDELPDDEPPTSTRNQRGVSDRDSVMEESSW
jgi:hypothetical protein